MKIDVGDDVELRVIHRGVGGITEGDINLAIADNVIVLGFNVRAEGKATELANREGVEIRYYSVIYQAIEEIEAGAQGHAQAGVRGGRAGPGRGPRGLPVLAVRHDRGLPGDGRGHPPQRQGPADPRQRGGGREPVDRSLRRDKDDVVEVREGYECGLTLGSFNDIKEGDVIETFEMREKPRA